MNTSLLPSPAPVVGPCASCGGPVAVCGGPRVPAGLGGFGWRFSPCVNRRGGRCSCGLPQFHEAPCLTANVAGRLAAERARLARDLG